MILEILKIAGCVLVGLGVLAGLVVLFVLKAMKDTWGDP